MLTLKKTKVANSFYRKVKIDNLQRVNQKSVCPKHAKFSWLVYFMLT